MRLAAALALAVGCANDPTWSLCDTTMPNACPDGFGCVAPSSGSTRGWCSPTCTDFLETRQCDAHYGPHGFDSVASCSSRTVCDDGDAGCECRWAMPTVECTDDAACVEAFSIDYMCLAGRCGARSSPIICETRVCSLTRCNDDSDCAGGICEGFGCIAPNWMP